MTVQLLEYPTEKDWVEVQRRALVTVGKAPITTPSLLWKKKILKARHSPIRYMRFSFLIDCPYWVSVHYARHIHAQPYVKSQRNDRQSEYDRNTAPQDAPVRMILDVNGEELLNIMNKRLCNKAAAETRAIAEMMKNKVLKVCPEFEDVLVPACVENGGLCKEMKSCREETNE